MKLIHVFEDSIVIEQHTFPAKPFFIDENGNRDFGSNIESSDKLSKSVIQDKRILFDITDPSKLLVEIVLNKEGNYSLIDKSSNLEKKEITKEEFEKLSPLFKKKFALNKTKVTEVHQLVDFYIQKEPDTNKIEVKSYPFKFEEISKNRDLVNRVNFLSDAAKKGLLSFSSIGVKASMFNSFLVMLSKDFPSENAIVLDYKIEYTAKPYRGELKKVLDKKSNGQPYADRRGRMFPDYKAIDSLNITLDSPWNSKSTLLDSKNYEEIKEKALKILKALRFEN